MESFNLSSVFLLPSQSNSITQFSLKDSISTLLLAHDLNAQNRHFLSFSGVIRPMRRKKTHAFGSTDSHIELQHRMHVPLHYFFGGGRRTFLVLGIYAYFSITNATSSTASWHRLQTNWQGRRCLIDLPSIVNLRSSTAPTFVETIVKRF